MLNLFIDILRNSILITGLVVVMMMMIESLNIESKGMVFNGLKKTRFGQVVIAALLGSIPGCMGGFATVSLYTHKLFSFGALVAMMIASSGDEAFIMLAMIPDQALLLFALLFIIAIIAGVSVDFINDRILKRGGSHNERSECSFQTHPADQHAESNNSQPKKRHFGWKRITMLIGLALFIAALASGQLGHDHSGHAHSHETTTTEHHCDCCHEETHINLLSEDWMNVLFAGLSVIMLFVLLLGSDHFVEDHLWNHIIKKHLPVIFAWTFGVLLVMGICLQYFDISKWISNNTAWMILLAGIVGLIPESGPHLIFVTLFATGVAPFSVLLTSSISQDGHSSIPLLAENKKSFAWAKLINLAIALAAGYITFLIF